ncbi:MAG TPA: succinylglutamate desuccinylase/aspartoacylase family protein [Gemmatimonadales bacterium]
MAKLVPRIGGTAIRRGQVTRAEIPVARLHTGTHLSLPVLAVRGTKPGPIVWLSAALHGDEINGVEIIRDVLAQVEPHALRGTVLATPVVNVFGFVAESRYLPDRRDLNRSFPGSATGSLASRLAHLFMTEIVSHCTHGIDLHTGSDHRTNWPHVRGNLGDLGVRRMAEAFGAPLLVNSKLIDGSLRQAAAAADIPCLVYEAGEAARFDKDAIATGVDGILRVLVMLKMLRQPVLPPATAPVLIEKTRWVRATRSGILRLEVEPGDQVRRGQQLGTIGDPFGEAVAVKAPASGFVLGVTRFPLVHRGDGIVHVAVHKA